MPQVFWGVGHVDDGAQRIPPRGRFLPRLRQGAHILKDWRVFRQDSLEDTKLDIACNEDDVPVVVPEFRIALPWRCVRDSVAFDSIFPYHLPGDAAGHL